MKKKVMTSVSEDSRYISPPFIFLSVCFREKLTEKFRTKKKFKKEEKRKRNCTFEKKKCQNYMLLRFASFG